MRLARARDSHSQSGDELNERPLGGGLVARVEGPWQRFLASGRRGARVCGGRVGLRSSASRHRHRGRRRRCCVGGCRRARAGGGDRFGTGRHRRRSGGRPLCGNLGARRCFRCTLRMKHGHREERGGESAQHHYEHARRGPLDRFCVATPGWRRRAPALGCACFDRSVERPPEGLR
jgi:hypothetical protein